MGSSGCQFTSIASNANGFIFGNQVPGSPYDGAPANAGSARRDYPITVGLEPVEQHRPARTHRHRNRAG
jgi:hypothetical protein